VARGVEGKKEHQKRATSLVFFLSLFFDVHLFSFLLSSSAGGQTNEEEEEEKKRKTEMKFRVQATLPLPADVYFLERDSAAFRALLARVSVSMEEKEEERER